CRPVRGGGGPGLPLRLLLPRGVEPGTGGRRPGPEDERGHVLLREGVRGGPEAADRGGPQGRPVIDCVLQKKMPGKFRASFLNSLLTSLLGMCYALIAKKTW